MSAHIQRYLDNPSQHPEHPEHSRGCDVTHMHWADNGTVYISLGRSGEDFTVVGTPTNIRAWLDRLNATVSEFLDNAESEAVAS